MSRLWVEALAKDLRYGLRSLRRNPGFAAGAVLSLALGIGANVAAFTLLDRVLLRDLPVRSPRELVQLLDVGPHERSPNGSFSYPVFERMRAARALAGMTAVAQLRVSVAVDGEPQLTRAELVSGNFHQLLDVPAAVGRILTDDDDRKGRAVAVLSHAYWEARFGSDPAVVGRAVTIDGHPFEIVGVTQREFFGVDSSVPNDVTLPISTQPLFARPALDDPGRLWLQILGRIDSGESRETAEAALDLVYQDCLLSRKKGSARQQRRLTLEGAAGGLGNIRRAAKGAAVPLLATVGGVLAIACTNVAMLLGARGAARARELGVRLALGAERRRLVRQLLTESLLLASLGGAAGFLLAAWSQRLLLAWLPPLGRPIGLELGPDARALAFTLLLSAATSLCFGLAPALRATRVDPNLVIRNLPSRPAAGKRRPAASQALVGVQFALALVLVVAAGLLVRGVRQIDRIDFGFDRASVLVVTVDGMLGGYKAHELPALYRRVLERVASIPGVEDASLAKFRLIADAPAVAMEVPGYEPSQGEDVAAALNVVGPNFFHTMRIPLLAGRDFAASDHENAPGVAVINETLARRFFGDAIPLGRRLRVYASRAPEVEIVGVAADVRPLRARDPVEPGLFLSYMQVSEALGNDRKAPMMIQARVAGAPESLAPEVRRAVREIDRNLPITELRSLADQIEDHFSEHKLAVALSGTLGILALALAGIGLAGSMSYAVARRRREISVRMALGANPRNIVGLVVRRAVAVVAAGVAAGLPAALALGRVLSARVPGLGGIEAPTVASSIGLMIATALLAALLPAHRASRFEAVEALRHD